MLKHGQSLHPQLCVPVPVICAEGVVDTSASTKIIGCQTAFALQCVSAQGFCTHGPTVSRPVCDLEIQEGDRSCNQLHDNIVFNTH